jgi:hypothetical protein
VCGSSWEMKRIKKKIERPISNRIRNPVTLTKNIEKGGGSPGLLHHRNARGKANRAAVFTGARREASEAPAARVLATAGRWASASGGKGRRPEAARRRHAQPWAPPLLCHPPGSGQLLRLYSLCAGIEEGEKERERRAGEPTGTDPGEASTSSPPATFTAPQQLPRLEKRGGGKNE